MQNLWTLEIMTMLVLKLSLLIKIDVKLDGGKKMWIIIYIKISMSKTLIYLLCIFVKDASLCGWRAVMESQSTKGLFSTSEKEEHTNMLELKAILFGLKVLTKGFTKPHEKVLSDNSLTKLVQ